MDRLMDSKRALKRLDEFKSLKKNWDSYGGLKPDHTAIEKSKKLIEGLFVCPMNNGNIEITLGDEEVTLIVDNQGGVSVVLV